MASEPLDVGKWIGGAAAMAMAALLIASPVQAQSRSIDFTRSQRAIR